MDDKKHGLSKGVAQIVRRLFMDEPFKDDALANPELAFEGYGLDEEERQALRSLMGSMSRHSLFSTKVGPDNLFW